MGKYKAYGVLVGRKRGVYDTWAECEAQVKGYVGAIYKGFMTVDEAILWVNKEGHIPPEFYMEQEGLSREEAAEKSEAMAKAVAKSKAMAKRNATEKSEEKLAGKSQKVASAVPGEEFNPATYFCEDHLDTNVLPPQMPENYAFVDGSYNENCNGRAVYGFGGIVHVNGVDEYISGHGCEEEYVSSRQIPGEVFGSIAAIRKAIELGADHVVIFYDYAGIGHWATSGKRWKAEKPIAKEYVRLYDELSQKIKVNFYHVKAHTGIQGNEQVDDMAKREVGLV